MAKIKSNVKWIGAKYNPLSFALIKSVENTDPLPNVHETVTNKGKGVWVI